MVGLLLSVPETTLHPSLLFFHFSFKRPLFLDSTWKSTSLERRCWRARAVEVDVLPLAVSAMPHSSLLWLAGARSSLAVHILSQADVRDASCIFPNQVHMGVQDGGVDWFAVLGQKVFKVKSMEIHSFYQVAKCLRLKWCKARITNFCVGFEVSIVDGFYQLFCDLNNFLFACWFL